MRESYLSEKNPRTIQILVSNLYEYENRDHSFYTLKNVDTQLSQ